jgi:hypothetical protein
MSSFHHVGKALSISSPSGGLSTAIAAVARRGKEYHVVAAVEGHELKTPETEHRPGLESLMGSCSSTRSRPLPGAPTIGVSTPGVPGPTSKLSPRAPAQMGRREAEREGGKTAGGRQAWEVEPAAFVLAPRPGRVRLQ